MVKQKITIPEGYELSKVNDYEYIIVKKEKELPNSWEEFCETHKIEDNEHKINNYSDIVRNGLKTRSPINDRNFLPNKEYAEAILALCQLIQLRDCYRQGWKPDWKETTTTKECIVFINDDFWFKNHVREAKIFSFQSDEIRDKFYRNFKGLIEKIRPLFV